MMTRVWLPVCCVSLILSHYSVRAGETATGSTTQPSRTTSGAALVAVDLNAARDGLRLEGGVQIRMSRDAGAISAKVSSRLVNHSWTFSRDVIIYVPQPVSTFIIIDDRFASDEDRLVIYDMQATLRPLRISHDSTDSYSHQHFIVSQLVDDGVIVIEKEYAGDSPPREREMRITRKKKGFTVAKGEWVKR